jgi:hypothetical protein
LLEENERQRDMKYIRKISAVALLLVCWLAMPSYAAYIKRYTTIANGGMTYTGNTLGLDKLSTQNNPGTNGAIGAFITLNPLLKVGTYP